jgi:diguanylate cyclase (GGDEF)-like protein
MLDFNDSQDLMKQVLLVESNPSSGSLLKNYIESMLQINVMWVQTFQEAKKIMDDFGASFFVAILDINLEGTPNGEIVDYAISKKIPVIGFTSDISDEQYEKLWSKKIVDFVFKKGPDSLDYIISLLKRLENNKNIKILVVDDSVYHRDIICKYLQRQNYIVHEAGNSKETLKILAENPDIKMVITDYMMPDIDGLQLIKIIRQKFKKEKLAIIGMSAEKSNLIPASFIKYGANDFISKPFQPEEFYCRVNQNIDIIEYVETINEASHTDYLTGLYNRRYFFKFGSILYANANRNNSLILIAMIDIDHFKKINDNYGHDAGDIVLKMIAQILKNKFRKSDIVSRFGGEEFCILAMNMEKDHVFRIFDNLRKYISQTDINIGYDTIKVSVSIGLCLDPLVSLDAMINQADKMLYRAKESGRNRVLYSK